MIARDIHYNGQDKLLCITYDEGDYFELSAELLRVESPSAEVKGHGIGEKKIIAGKQDVTITAIEAVGNYAVRLIFSDGHDTGLYTWEYLHKLGKDKEKIWTEYLKNLQDKNLSRDTSTFH